jgi:hypothetical protein
LKSGVSRPVSHISSMLRWVSRSSRRLDWMRLNRLETLRRWGINGVTGAAYLSPPACRRVSAAKHGVALRVGPRCGTAHAAIR